MSSSPGLKKNRLAREKSPYLLQHASNPVDWFPWSPEAFEKAKTESKLVFLSIGYSTCHWCHVMEKESFESEDIAALLNKDFISIKVDREERPDIDAIYMTAVQAMTGSGGWPLNIFLTPEGKPVTGGTYFPPEDRWGRPGMKTILPRLAKVWRENRTEAEKAADELVRILQPHEQPSGRLDVSVLKIAYEQFSKSFDPEYGGFGGEPKFPRSHDLSFLLSYYYRSGDGLALEMVNKTLISMAMGGIYDHLGGGFHRYSTDEKWLVPHFEKMLYDQAMLARTYLQAYQFLRTECYADTARGILRYVMRDMTDTGGGFYSAEDADSEGEEGKFYVWRPEEILLALGREQAELFCEFYQVTDQGSFEHAASILHLTQSLEEFAKNKKLDARRLAHDFAEAREKLFEIRRKRIPPYKDDKILTAWNGLMISAFALAAKILGDPDFRLHASRAADFILKNLSRNGRLLRRYREGEASIEGFQDDYAFFSLGLLDLYEATWEVRWLEESLRLTREMIRLFWDGGAGGFFYSAADHETLIARNKEYYDGATPSGNSVAAILLLRLARMTGDQDLQSKADSLLEANAAAAFQHPMAFPQFLIAADFAFGPVREAVIAGDFSQAGFDQLAGVLRRKFDPRLVQIHHPSSDAGKIERLIPFIKEQRPVGGKPAVYLCENFTCKQSVTEASALEALFSMPHKDSRG